MSRERASERRKREILEAALACFGELGYEKTTLAEIRARSEASTGSIYHHFRSKEQLFAALYLEGIRATQAFGLRALRRAAGAQEGVRVLVGSYLRWVQRNPEMARYLLTMRRAEFMLEAEGELERENARLRGALRDWMQSHVRAGELPRAGQDLVLALLFGPSEDFARRWLRGKTTTSLSSAADRLGTAAWASLRALTRDGG